jgi:prephenate dehydratase
MEFQEQVEPLPRPSFRGVFEAVLSGEALFGVIPIENSLAGSIHENYDLLLEYPDLQIVGERKIRIVHNLIGLPGAAIEDLRRVYSHPQGLAQCAAFLDRYPSWERVPYYDTAGAVGWVASQGSTENGAIASAEAAAVYGMAILKQGIETNALNYTRFFVIAREGAGRPGEATMASFVFATADKPGCLYRALSILAERGLNMKKLESRPILGKPWQYMFYVDVEMPVDRSTFDEAVKLLALETDGFRILGAYGG